MKYRRFCIAIAIAAVLIQSCGTSNSGQIEKIDKPDNKKVRDFGIRTTGDVIYQFYEKYGFTDIEEHLIMILKPDKVMQLTSTLPFDSVDMKRLQKIDLEKFIAGKPVSFELEKRFQEDIRIESKEFDIREEMPVFYGKGKYKIVVNDSIETVYIFDKQTGLLYVESKITNQGNN